MGGNGERAMRIVVAEDDPVSRRLLEVMLDGWGHRVFSCGDGEGAIELLASSGEPTLAVLDWMMPGADGLDVCVAVRAMPRDIPPYLILLTARGERDDVVQGFEAGADDYIVKPFHRRELKARVDAGVRLLRLQQEAIDRVHSLEEALARVKQLEGLVPICTYCKKIREDDTSWEQIEAYLARHTDARFSHSICPHCYETVVQPQIDALTGPVAPKACGGT